MILFNEKDEEMEQAVKALLKKRPLSVSLPSFDPAWLTEIPRHLLAEDQVVAPRKTLRSSLQSIFANPNHAAIAATFLFAFSALITVITLKHPDAQGGRAALREQYGEMRGVVLYSEGEVILKRGDRRKFLRQGDTVDSGDWIYSGKSGKASVLISPGSSFQVEGETEIQLHELRRAKGQGGRGRLATLFVRKGEIISSIERLTTGERFTVRTPGAIAEVRGTTFRIVADEKNTDIQLLKGGLEVQDRHNHGSVVLTDREKLTLVPDNAMKKETMSSDENEVIARISSELKTRARTVDPGLLVILEEMGRAGSDEELNGLSDGTIEVVKLKDGSVYRGLVISQREDKMVIQSVDGVHIVNSVEVQEIRYIPVD